MGMLSAEDSRSSYLLSFVISICAISFALFVSPTQTSSMIDKAPDHFEMVNIDKVAVQKRMRKKSIDIGSAEESVNQIERADGFNEDEETVDLSFYPNVVPPRPIGALKKIYPDEARQREVEATVFVRLVISSAGQVLSVQVLSVKLHKAFPKHTEKTLQESFAGAATESLQSARFFPPIVDGKKVSIIMEMPLMFQLK